MTVLLILFQFRFLVSFPCLIVLTRTSSILCWITLARLGILVLFLILEEMLSIFYCWVWDSVQFSHSVVSDSLRPHELPSAFSKTSLNIWKFRIHILLKPGLANFEHFFTSVWDECNRVVVWAFFGIAFLWDWNEPWPFSVLWALLSFPDLLAYWVHHLHNIIF